MKLYGNPRQYIIGEIICTLCSCDGIYHSPPSRDQPCDLISYERIKDVFDFFLPVYHLPSLHGAQTDGDIKLLFPGVRACFMVYAGQRAEKSQRGMHLNAAGERRSSGSQSAARGAAAQRMGAPRARMRPLAAGVWRVVRSLLSPNFSLPRRTPPAPRRP